MYQKQDTRAVRGRMPAPQSAGVNTIPDRMEFTHEFVEQKINLPISGTLLRKP